MRNPSQILQLMIDSGYYSRNVPFMCNALLNAYEADDITGEEMDAAEEAINQLAIDTYGSNFLGFAGCLIRKLKAAGLVARSASSYDPEAYQACLAVYVGWIEKLSSPQSE